MERKIGEIFEFKKDWYQCVEGRCKDCHFSEKRFLCKQFITKDFCTHGIIFKKLEKVGESYMTGNKLIQRYKIYPTTCCINVYGWYYQNLDVKSWTIDLEIKQSKKEDMEIDKVVMNIDDRDYLLDRLEAILHDTHCQQYKDEICEAFSKYIVTETASGLKPFDLNAAKLGKPVCTRDGRKARIICFDMNSFNNHIIVALITEENGTEFISSYTSEGKWKETETENDLMMLPEKKEGWVNLYDDMPIYDTKEEALNFRSEIRDLIDTIKVSWEE